jgi:hypothetical protein
MFTTLTPRVRIKEPPLFVDITHPTLFHYLYTNKKKKERLQPDEGQNTNLKLKVTIVDLKSHLGAKKIFKIRSKPLAHI